MIRKYPNLDTEHYITHIIALWKVSFKSKTKNNASADPRSTSIKKGRFYLLPRAQAVSNCMVLGDQRKHLACIITLRTVLDENNLPTNDLHPDVIEWAENLGAESETVTDLIAEDNEEVRLEIMAQIQKVNRRAISNAQKVHKFMIAPKDFTLPGGEMTPTMKIKRHTIMEQYKKKIDQMYEHETQSSMW